MKPEASSSGIAAVDEAVKNPELMINYKYRPINSVTSSIDDSMSPVHLFFRDYTGAILAFIAIISFYLIIVLPSSWVSWLTPFFQIHGKIDVEGQTLYEKSINDLFTVVSFTFLLLIVRYFLCNTLFSLIAKWLKIENSLENPQIVHKCQVSTRIELEQ